MLARARKVALGAAMLAAVKHDISARELSVADANETELMPGDVRLHVDCAGICGSDLMIQNGSFPWKRPPTFPLILGHEALGTVVEVGPRVRDLRVGQRVVPEC